MTKMTVILTMMLMKMMKMMMPSTYSFISYTDGLEWHHRRRRL
jgi:hypothetical protein